ncbi:MAG TPA: calcium-binding protein, partial [Jatrophihabitans sp.]|nr:calcium-binding protein [Jatrophihabitans sp.]
MSGRRIAAGITAFATALGMSVAIAAIRPAVASAGPVDPLATGLVQWFSYLGGLADKGALGTDLTGTTLDVGGTNGLDLAGLAGQLNSESWSTASSVDAIAGALDGLDGTHGAWQLSTSANTAANGHGVAVDMQITRTVDVGLSLDDPAKSFALSSPTGVRATLTAHLVFTAERDDSDPAHFWIDHGTSTPTFTAGVSANIPDGSQINAALGILGVSVSNTDFQLTGSIDVSFADPNGDGKLDFTEADGSDGELSAKGSAGGVATPSVAPGGSLDGDLTLAGQSSTLLDNLPDLSATVHVSSSDIASGHITATFDSNAFDAIKPFQTMETKDLATALAQLASALQTAQRTNDLPLPLLKGTAADAIQAGQAIEAFLNKYVEQPPAGADASDPAKYIGTGHPKFSSLQDLIDKLSNYTDPKSGASISIGALDAQYDTSGAQPKVRLTLHLSNHASAATALDVVGPALTGSGPDVSYGACTQSDHSDCTLTDASRTTAQTKFTADLAGRQVTAGTSTAVIDHVSADGQMLFLSTTPFVTDPPTPVPTVLWKGGIPAGGTAYSISGADPRTGQVQMADALKADSGILSVNASVPQATITPHYDATLPLVLDLEPSTQLATPQTVNNPDGTQSIITATPTLIDRIMMHTGETLLAGDLPIHTKVDATAKVGFLQVHVGGSLQLCTNAPGVGDDCSGSASDDTTFVNISTKQTGDADHDIALPDLFDDLAHNPGDLLTGSFNGRAYGELKLSVPGENGFFTGGETTAMLKWTDISDPNTLSFTGPDLSKLLSFDISNLDDPTKLFGALIKALQTLDSSLHTGGSGSGSLDTKLPLIGKSVHDLLGSVEQGGPSTHYTTDTLADNSGDHDFTGYEGRRLLVGSATEVITNVIDSHTVQVSPAFTTVPADGTSYTIGDALLAALDKLAANPSDSLNELAGALDTALGDPVSFDVQPAANGNPAYLKFKVDWGRTLPLRVPLKFDLSVPNVPSSILGTSGKGTIDITATGNINVTLLFPLTTAAIADPVGSLLIDPSSGAHLKVDLHSEGVTLAANLGPLALSVGDPTAQDPGTEINGKLGFNLTGTGSQPQSLSDFFSGLDVSADRNDDVTCTGVTGNNLALCANLPLYYKDGSTWTALGTGVKVHVPQSVDFGNLGDYVDLPDAGTIASALASQLIDLSSLGNGLDGYLQLLNTALALADTAGKLPVVGKDVQQGLDFINGIKNAIETVIPVDANGGAQQLTDSDFLQSKLDDVATQLQTSLHLPTTPHFYVSTTCTATLDHVQNLADDGSVNGGDTSTDYTYRVIAVHSGNTTGDSRPSDPLTLHNAATLDSSHFNKFKWDPSTWATGYQVEVQVGGTWKVLDTITDTSFTDDGTVAPGTVDSSNVTSDPTLNPCPGSAITGFKVKVVIGQGTVGADGCSGNDCVTAGTRPLDLGLPGLSLSTNDPDNPNDDPNNQVHVSVGWELHLSFGLTKDKGFVVFTQDNDSDPSSPNQTQSTPELAIGAALVAPKQFNGRLAFLSMQAQDTEDQGSSTAHRQFAGAFSVDLHGAGDQPCPVGGCAVDTNKVLTPDDFASNDLSSLVTAKLEASVSLHYQVTVLADAALPGIRADFHLDWGWQTGDSPDKTSGLQLGFDDIRINPGSFLLKVLGPIFKQINAVYGPIKPILDTVSAPLPVLSDLSHLAGGGDVSILTLAAAFANGNGDTQTFDDFIKIFNTVKSVLDVINNISNACSTANPDDYDNDANFCIHLGSFDLDNGFTFNTTLTPDTADGGITNPQPSSQSLFDQLDDKTSGKLGTAANDAAGSGEKNACGAAKDDRGFTFPALKQPTSLFGLLMGKDVELVCFDSGPLSLGFTMSEAFGPVYAPPPVLIVLSGSASVSVRIAAGFDTYGFRKAVEDSDAGVLSRAVDVLDSLYFKTTDTDGNPIPVLQFQGSIAAGAEVSAVIISVGVEGGISLTVSFYWNDPDNDGKFRFSEFLTTALSNPICLFNVGGELDLFLKVFVTIGFSPFSVTFDFTLVNIKLLDFSLKPDCTPPPPELGGMDGGTLYLFAGHLGTEALRGDQAWDNHGSDDEKVVVRQHKDDAQTVTVQMLGISEDFTGVNKVVLDGRNYGGKINALFQGDSQGAVYDRPTVIVGGDNDDTFKTGSGPVWIDGGGGKDLIVSGDRPDLSADAASNTALVTGGGSDDSITVGSANDAAYGDGSLQIPTLNGINVHRNNDRGDASLDSLDVSDTSAIHPPGDPDAPGGGNDRIAVGLGQDDVWGGSGDDTVGVAADSPLAATHAGDSHYLSAGVTAHGGPGSDLISTGSGNDTIFTGDTFTPGSDQDVIADRNAAGDAGTTNTVDTGTARDTGTETDTVYGGDGADFVTGHSAGSTKDLLYGGPADDVLMGGYGKDELWGGQGDDYLIAEPSTVGAADSATDVLGSARTVQHSPTTTTPQEKLLVGGGGHDRIYGGDGG